MWEVREALFIINVFVLIRVKLSIINSKSTLTAFITSGVPGVTRHLATLLWCTLLDSVLINVYKYVLSCEK